MSAAGRALHAACPGQIRALLGAGLRCPERAVQCQSFALHVAEPLLRIFLKKEMLASSPTRSAIDTQNPRGRAQRLRADIMRISRWNVTGALAVWAFTSTADAQTARTAPDPIESHRAAGKNAAGG